MKKPAKPMIAYWIEPEIVETPARVTISLPMRLTNSNDGQSRHWSQSHKMRNDVHDYFKQWYLHRTPFSTSVSMTVTRMLGKGERLVDPSSMNRGNWKQIEDTFVQFGWLQDDSAKWISSYTFQQDDTQRVAMEFPRVVVEFKL